MAQQPDAPKQNTQAASQKHDKQKVTHDELVAAGYQSKADLQQAVADHRAKLATHSQQASLPAPTAPELVDKLAHMSEGEYEIADDPKKS